MARLGILDTISLAAALALAAPLGLFGARLLWDGRALGAVFLALALAMVAFEQFLVSPSDVPAKIVGFLAIDDDENDA